MAAERLNLNEVANGVKVTPCWPRVVDGEAPRGNDRTPTGGWTEPQWVRGERVVDSTRTGDGTQGNRN